VSGHFHTPACLSPKKQHPANNLEVGPTTALEEVKKLNFLTPAVNETSAFKGVSSHFNGWAIQSLLSVPQSKNNNFVTNEMEKSPFEKQIDTQLLNSAFYVVFTRTASEWHPRSTEPIKQPLQQFMFRCNIKIPLTPKLPRGFFPSNMLTTFVSKLISMLKHKHKRHFTRHERFVCVLDVSGPSGFPA
jgi:hypothetical protein